MSDRQKELHRAYVKKLFDKETAQIAGYQQTLAWKNLLGAEEAYKQQGQETWRRVAGGTGSKETKATDLAIGRSNAEGTWLAFRGTAADGGARQWLGERGNIFSALAEFHHTQVHGGFLASYMDMAPDIYEYLADLEPCTLHITGHSRGAGLATIAGLDLALRFPYCTIEVVAWASPRVGVESFQVRCLCQQNLHVAVVANSRDVVTMLPPSKTSIGAAALQQHLLNGDELAAIRKGFVHVTAPIYLDGLCPSKTAVEISEKSVTMNILGLLSGACNIKQHLLDTYKENFSYFFTDLRTIRRHHLAKRVGTPLSMAGMGVRFLAGGGAAPYDHAAASHAVHEQILNTQEFVVEENQRTRKCIGKKLSQLLDKDSAEVALEKHKLRELRALLRLLDYHSQVNSKQKRIDRAIDDILQHVFFQLEQLKGCEELCSELACFDAVCEAFNAILLVRARSQSCDPSELVAKATRLIDMNQDVIHEISSNFIGPEQFREAVPNLEKLEDSLAAVQSEHAFQSRVSLLNIAQYRSPHVTTPPHQMPGPCPTTEEQHSEHLIVEDPENPSLCQRNMDPEGVNARRRRTITRRLGSCWSGLVLCLPNSSSS